MNGGATTAPIGLPHTAEARRIGLHDFGLGVNYAARIGAAASGGEILASESTLEAAKRDIPKLKRRSMNLEGIAEPVAAGSVSWQ